MYDTNHGFSTDLKRTAWVILPAAGIGSRMQSDIPKQYLEIDGKTVLEHTISRFATHPAVAGILVALHPEDQWWQQIKKSIKVTIPIKTVTGGNKRSDSVENALCALRSMNLTGSSPWVMVHDAARPCVSKADIDTLMELTQDESSIGGILAYPVHDTMKRADPANNNIESTVDRQNLWHALTPQLFKQSDLLAALQQARKKGIVVTDEASAMEHSGYSPHLVKGSSYNIKITRPGDLELAGWLMKNNN